MNSLAPKLVIVLLSYGMLPLIAAGQFTHNFTPTSSGTHSFATAANWDVGTVPGSSSHFVRFNNPPADSTAATAMLTTTSDVTIGGFEMNSLSANFTISANNKYVRLEPASAFTSTIASGRRLTLSGAYLTGNENAVLENNGQINGGWLIDLAVTNDGSISRGSFGGVGIEGSNVQQTSNGRISNVYLFSSIVSGGSILSGNGGNAVQYENSTINAAYLGGTDAHEVIEGTTNVFNGITYSATENLYVDPNSVAVFQGTSILNRSIDNRHGGTVTLDGGTIVGSSIINSVNVNSTVNGHGILQSMTILNSIGRGTVAATTGDIVLQGSIVNGGGFIAATGGDVVYNNSTVSAAILSGSQDHIAGTGTNAFNSVTIDAGATLTLTGNGTAFVSGNNSTIHGTLRNLSTNAPTEPNSAHLTAGTITGSGQVVNESGSILSVGSVGNHVTVDVATVQNAGILRISDGSFTGDAIDNTNGRIVLPLTTSLITLNTTLTGGSIELNGGHAHYEGGSLTSTLLYGGQHHVHGDMTFQDTTIDSFAALSIDNTAQAFLQGTVTNNGVINGDVTLLNGATLAGFGSHNGLLNSLNNYAAGGSQNVSSLTVGDSMTSGTDTIGIVMGTSLISSSPVTVANDGVLQIDSTSSLEASSLQVAGALQLNGSFIGDVFLQQDGVISGTGSVQGTVYAADGSIISIGNSPGELLVNNLVFGIGTHSYEFEIKDAAGEAGSDWDLLTVEGNLDFAAGAMIDIDLSSLGADDLPGAIANFDSEASYSWKLASAASMTGFANATLVVETSDFLNPITGVFSVAQQGNEIRLLYSPALEVPGDFDNDGDVDGRDFLEWQRNPSVGSLADWQANYGTPALAATTGALTVPEPTGALFRAVLMLSAFAAQPARRTRY